MDRMDSDQSDDNEQEQDQFAKQGGEALDLDGDFQDSEDVDEEEDDVMQEHVQKKESSAGKGA